LNLTPEARKVLMNATTGELEKGKNLYDGPHRKYNAAAKRHLERFLRESGIGDRPMTADEARKLLDSILRSKDPDIREFNSKLAKKPPPPRGLVGIIFAAISFLLRRGR